LPAVKPTVGAGAPSCGNRRGTTTPRGKAKNQAGGALLSDMGFEPELAKGAMLIARCISLVAHTYEEMTKEKGWRASSGQIIIQPLDLRLQRPEFYDGPENREFPPDRVKS
jgi:citrate synthase